MRGSVVLAVAVVATGLWMRAVLAAGEQPPLRIGGSISKTGAYAAIAGNVHRGIQLCVKDTNARGGLLGRTVEYLAEDDRSQAALAVRIYERLIAREKVDAVFSPYSSQITDAVADGTEKYRMPMVASSAAATSIYRKGRRFIFMFTSPAEAYLEGVIHIAPTRGLETLALIHEDTLFATAIARGAMELARRKGLEVVLVEKYPRGDVAFRVDPDGVQVAHRLLVFQWQDSRKVIVWPDELAPGKPRLTPPWSAR